jgi:hypothetical protein
MMQSSIKTGYPNIGKLGTADQRGLARLSFFKGRQNAEPFKLAGRLNREIRRVETIFQIVTPEPFSIGCNRMCFVTKFW